MDQPMEQPMDHIDHSEEHHTDVPFVGRQNELAYIDNVICEWGTRRLLCIDGSAGVGKSYLLHEVRRRHTTETSEKIPMLLTDIIDFEDPSLSTLQNIQCRIVYTLGERIFEPYLRVLLNWRKMELSGAGVEQLRQSALAVNRTFVDCFNMVSARIIIFIDSVDTLKQPDMLDEMIAIGRQLENVVVVLAGRNTSMLGEKLQTSGSSVQTIILKPFPAPTSEIYAYRKQKARNDALPPEVLQTIIMLAGGHPVLLDLGMQRHLRNVSLDWLHTTSLDTLHALPHEQRQQHIEAFESDLARYVADTSQLKGWLTLLLSRICVADASMIAELLAVPEDTARTLIEKAQQQVFIKKLPGGRICLHDEVRRIINEHVWPVVDPSGEQQRQYSKQIVTYMEHTIEALEQQINRLHIHSLAVYDEPTLKVVCAPFLKKTTLEQERDSLHVRKLAHILFTDSTEGLRMFGKMFDETTRAYNFGLRKKLLHEVERYREQIAPPELYELESRRVQWLLDETSYQQARDLASHLLDQPDMPLDPQVAMLIQRGNAEIRLGNIDRSIEDFNRALSLSGEQQLLPLLNQSHYARGWALFNQGKYDLALADFLESYQGCLKDNNFRLIAWILLNIGYIHALRGNQHAALESCHAALELWEEIASPRGIGAAYETFGEIYVRFNQPVEAITSYTKAMDIFAAQHDIEWMSVVRCGRAFAFQLRGENEKAHDDQQWALAHGPFNLRPRILHSQALTFLGRGDVEQARHSMEECRQVSQQLGDIFHDYKSFADLIELAWDLGECNRWQEFYDEHERLYVHRTGTDSLRLRGSCLRKIADLAICDGAYDTALEAYKRGLPIIAEYEVHGRYTIRSQIRQTDHRLRKRVAGSVLHRLGRDLMMFWQEHPELIGKYPEVLLLFNRW